MLEVFNASVENIKEVKRQRSRIKKLFNNAVLKNDLGTISLLTRLYALLYSSFAELCFLKIIHTPYGFAETDIAKIRAERNLEQQWGKCLELCFDRINNPTNATDIQRKREQLINHVQKFVIGPSQLRNKIAHGQWIIALNNDNTALNAQTTARIAALDFVQIDVLFGVYENIGQAVEDLIESPRKAHFNDFYVHMANLDALVEKNSQLEFGI